MFNRILDSNMCDYFALQKCSLRDVFDMLLILDWRDYAQGYAEIVKKAKS